MNFGYKHRRKWLSVGVEGQQLPPLLVLMMWGRMSLESVKAFDMELAGLAVIHG